MEQIMLIPSWGAWMGVVFLVFLALAVFVLKRQIHALESKAEVIEEIQAARRKQKAV